MSTDPEEASMYLNRTNFKQLVEWLTAEAVLRRPDDPLLFMRDLVEAKVGERGTDAYVPDQPVSYVERTYADAAALADEHGRIYGHVASKGGGGKADGVSEERVVMLERLVRAASAITDLEPQKACSAIVKASCDLLAAEAASIYTVRSGGGVLDLHVADDEDVNSDEKHLDGVNFGVGIAGTVAQTGQTCNIADCYSDPRFDSTHDKATGFKTCNMVVSPIKAPSGDVVGVLQVMNKAQGKQPFNSDDEEALAWLSGLAGSALYSARCYQATLVERQRAEALVDLVHAMHGESNGMTSLIHTLTTRLPQIAKCDRCTVFITDQKRGEIWAMQGEVNIKIPIDSPGIAASCARDKKTINIPDAYEDDRFNSKIDVETGYKTSSILCLPITAGEESLGVIQLMNKLPFGAFNEDDESTLKILLSICASIISDMTLAKREVETEAPGEEKATLKKASRSSRAIDKKPSQSVLVEEDEEEEDN